MQIRVTCLKIQMEIILSSGNIIIQESSLIMQYTLYVRVHVPFLNPLGLVLDLAAKEEKEKPSLLLELNSAPEAPNTDPVALSPAPLGATDPKIPPDVGWALDTAPNRLPDVGWALDTAPNRLPEAEAPNTLPEVEGVLPKMGVLWEKREVP